MSQEPPDLFQQLFRQHYAGVVLRITQLVRNQSVAEDLAQEVFLRLYRSPPDDLNCIGPWLHRVLTRVSYDYLRKTIRLRSVQTKMEQEEISAWMESGTENVLERRLDRERVTNVLGRLSDRDRQVLLLKHSGYSYAEIGEILAVRKEIVGSLLLRASQRFRKEFLQEEGEEDGGRASGDGRGRGLGSVSTASEG